MKNRTLRLRRETVTELGTDDMRSVAGASGNTCVTCWLQCATRGLSCVQCPSIPITNCTILQETDTVTCPTDIC